MDDSNLAPSFLVDRFVVPPRDDRQVRFALDFNDLQLDVIARRHDEAIQCLTRTMSAILLPTFFACTRLRVQYVIVIDILYSQGDCGDQGQPSKVKSSRLAGDFSPVALANGADGFEGPHHRTPFYGERIL